MCKITSHPPEPLSLWPLTLQQSNLSFFKPFQDIKSRSSQDSWGRITSNTISWSEQVIGQPKFNRKGNKLCPLTGGAYGDGRNYQWRGWGLYTHGTSHCLVYRILGRITIGLSAGILHSVHTYQGKHMHPCQSESWECCHLSSQILYTPAA